jgi:isopenicillin N synthase-like dioxygenase
MQVFYQDCVRVHGELLAIFEDVLGLRSGELRKSCSEENGEVRLTHYPAVPVAELRTGTTFRVAEHKDVGILTLLFQDSVGGLQAEDLRCPGQFLPVQSARVGEMVLIVGETLQCWTRKNLKSAKHRVADPPGSHDHETLPERFSVGFFGKANGTAAMKALAAFKSSNQAQGEELEHEGKTAQQFYNSAHEHTTTALLAPVVD